VTDTLEQVSALLHEAGETHHRVFRIVDGTDDDWASWYAQWLIGLSELPELAHSGRQRWRHLAWDQWPGSYLNESWSLVR
jgi:hypothetical protein